MTMLKQSELATADLPIEELRAHLRMGTGFGEDSLQDPVLESFLRAALATVETQTAKALLARPMTWILATWQATDVQILPMAPVASIDAVRFLRDGEDAVTLPASAWWLRKDDAQPALVSRSNSLPRPPAHAEIELRFVAGFGAWQDVPSDLKQAVMLLAAHYYENRSATQLAAGCMPFGVTALIEPHRLRRIGFGGSA